MFTLFLLLHVLASMVSHYKASQKYIRRITHKQPTKIAFSNSRNLSLTKIGTVQAETG